MRAAFAAALLLLSTLLYACSGDYSLCKQKFNDASVAQNNGLVIPVEGSRLLIYTPYTPKADVVQSNPFLGLYIVHTTTPFAYPFVLTEGTAKQIVAIDGVIALPGRVLEPQTGLDTLGRFEHPLADAAILTDACCALEGVVTREGVIGKAYIRHFLQSDGEVRYGDAGFRLEASERDVRIESIDPFMAENPFKPGDRITAFDGKGVASSAALMQAVLLSLPGTLHRVALQRDGRSLTLEVALRERFGGGLLSDTYLERAGIRFDREMAVVGVSPEARSLGIAPGDKLLQVNAREVAFDDEVRAALAEQAQKASLLFEREGFQFFVQLPFQKK